MRKRTGDLVFFSLISYYESQVVETISTGGYPYDLYYLPWLEEVWVHTWTNSTFDVINIAGNLEKTHKAIKAHVQPGKLGPPVPLLPSVRLPLPLSSYACNANVLLITQGVVNMPPAR